MFCGHRGGMAARALSFRPPKTAELIAEAVRADIRNGVLRAGSRLPGEAVLMETYSVSRPTLREALRMLEHDEVIEIRRGAHGGAAVRSPSGRPLARAIGDLVALTSAGVVDAAGLVELDDDDLVWLLDAVGRRAGTKNAGRARRGAVA
jgi:GntR family transcriptional regulator, transcriptional repressor for pyruvate dehydrogenase complex